MTEDVVKEPIAHQTLPNVKNIGLCLDTALGDFINPYNLKPKYCTAL